MDYPFSNSREHAKRSRSLYERGSLDCLLYAALEYRLSVESRLADFSELAEEFKEPKKNIWRIKDLTKHVDSVFGQSSLTYEVEITSPNLDQPLTLKYLPITKEIRETVGKLDNFLHHPGVSQCVHDGKEGELKRLLGRGLELLEEVLQEGLQGPPITDDDGNTRISIDPDIHPEIFELLREGEGIEMKFRVNEPALANK